MNAYALKEFDDGILKVDIQEFEDEYLYNDFIENLLDYKKYNHFLVFLYEATWDKKNGFKVFDNYKECFQRSYECSMYVRGGDEIGKSITLSESHHDVPMGHTSVIIGLTEEENDEIAMLEFDQIESFANEYRSLNISEQKIEKEKSDEKEEVDHEREN